MEKGSNNVMMVIKVTQPHQMIDLPTGLNDKAVTSLKLWNVSTDIANKYIQLRFSEGFRAETMTSGEGLRSDAMIIPLSDVGFPRTFEVTLNTRMPKSFVAEVYDEAGLEIQAPNLTLWFDVGVVNWY